MDSILFKIQDTVIDYANVISNITHVDVEVMDTNFRRVAGTGIFENRINENMENESFIYQKVLDSGEIMIVHNPRVDDICKDCPTKDACAETFEISAPIKLEGETIGVIGMMSNDEKTKDAIKVGDNVIYAKYSGTEVKIDGNEYIIVKFTDVLAVLED